MEDDQIIKLYWARSEDAITQTARKYGSYCYTIAYNILHSSEDSEECVNDTYMKTWSSLPPQLRLSGKDHPQPVSGQIPALHRRKAWLRPAGAGAGGALRLCPGRGQHGESPGPDGADGAAEPLSGLSAQ